MRGKTKGQFAPTRGPEVVEDDSSRWLGTYGDAVTLLMAFFVMLYALSEVDAVKFDAFLSGLEGPFGNTSVELLQGGGGIVGPGGSNPETADQTRIDSGDPVQVVMTEQAAAAEAELQAQEEAELRADQQLDELAVAVDAALQEVGLSAVADYRDESRGLVVSIASDDVLFELGSARVSDVGSDVIGAMATVLEQFPNDVLIEGHTDDLRVNRRGYDNFNLSTDRAVSVLNVMRRDHGIDPTRLGASGYGQYRPVAPNDTPGNRAKNRRVDVLFVEQGPNDG